MNKKSRSIITYCTGCGACVSAQLAKFEKDKKGFNVPKSKDTKFEDYCSHICFSQGRQYEHAKLDDGVWGSIKASFYAWSSNEEIRYKASSGGVLTALCMYLLESHIVDGIIQIKEDQKFPIGTIAVCSTSSRELIENSGSRYSSSAPLINIYDYLETGKKYCFVGKPCDVATIRNLICYDERFKKAFPILLSFFCAGAPSENANLVLLKKLKCDLRNCISLKYRGNGWPGYATAVDKNGGLHKMLYRDAWRDTLGRDIRRVCRFCSDGIGEMADIVCFDAWYLDSDKRPIFDEADGRNGVFCRNQKGLDIFKDAVCKGYIIASDYKNYKNDLLYYQTYQHDRRSTLLVCIAALKLCFLTSPCYPFGFMLKLMKNRGIRIQWRRFKGILSRIREGKI